jgi:sterol desaturase/sphingolipid hydroxylase (fatty acid hydroxylase superfamily)
MDGPWLDVPAVRGGLFVGVLVAMSIAERLWPRRPRLRSAAVRASQNLLLVALGQVVVRLCVPLAPVAFAASWSGSGRGLLPALGVAGLAGDALGLVLLDLAIWSQHVVFHKVPALWRLHAVHHADVDLDTTSGLRFHPIELVISTGFKLVVIAALGASAPSVAAFAVVLNASAMFNHANVALPPGVDRALRRVVVTPDMHRVHHGSSRDETEANYGFFLSVWDHLFRTHRAEPTGGQLGMEVGLPSFRSPREAWIDRLLTQPFRRAAP